MSKRARQVQAYFDLVRPFVLLADWDVQYLPDAEISPDNEAEIQILDGHRAEVAIGPDFFGYPPEKQRAIVLHELAHLHFARMRGLEVSTVSLLGVDARALFRAGLADAEEHIVEMISRLTTSRCPLPKFNKE
jgi:hypothetical protein